MKIWVYTISFNEAVMMPYFLRHYSTFADKIIVFDEHSTDGTRDMVLDCPKAELRDWPFHGLDDERFIQAVNNWYKEARGQADWVMWPDVDEILYHTNPIDVLQNERCAIIPARGYAMISRSGPPDGDGQIYDYVRMGVPQSNYDKWIIWRPSVEKWHTHGRHDRPMCNGPRSENFQFKLLHYHFFGVEYTRVRNRRNYDRCLDKRFAWNYAPGMTIRGTEAWVQKMLDTNQLFDVINHEDPCVRNRV